MRAAAAAGRVRGDVGDAHRAAGRRRASRRGAVADAVRVGAAHGQVQDDRQVMVERRLPRRRAHLRLGHGEVRVAVQVERDRLVGRVGPVQDHRVGVVAGLAARAPHESAADAVGLVARAAGIDTAVHGPRQLRQRVDVLHDVDLAVLRPLPGPEHPERRPVAEPARGLLDRGGDLQLAARGRAHVSAGRLHAAGGPGAAAAEGGDVEVAVAVEVHVAGRVGHRLDLAGAEAGAGPGVVHPLGVDAGSRPRR